jgi:hypothetical protein
MIQDTVLSSDYLALFYLFAPPTGAQTVEGSWSSDNPNKYKVSIITITGVTTLHSYSYSNGSGGTPPTATVDVAAKANGIIIGFVCGGALGADTLGDNQVEFIDDQTENPQLLGCIEAWVVDTTITVSWSFASTGETQCWAMIAASFYTA